MSLDFLPFSRPSIGEDEIAAVEQVLRSGWITTGPKNQELEQRFAERLGCRHAVALSSATGALHVTLLALGIGPGDEVITPSLTWAPPPTSSPCSAPPRCSSTSTATP